MNDETKDLVLSEAQLRAVRRLRQGESDTSAPRRRESRSQVERASTYSRGIALLDRIQAQFGVTVDRESLVSSLTKKVVCIERDCQSRAGCHPAPQRRRRFVSFRPCPTTHKG
jgi:hypothetical protein